MGFIGFLAAGLGAMRVGSWAVFRMSSAFAFLVLLGGLLGAIVRRGDGAWVGLALFGWFSLGISFVPAMDGDLTLDPSAEALDWLAGELHPQRDVGPAFPELNGQFMQLTNTMPFRQMFNDPRARSLLSPEETRKWDDFIVRWQTHEDASFRAQEGRFLAKHIGHYWFALVCGSLGAVLGRWMSNRMPSIANVGRLDQPTVERR